MEIAPLDADDAPGLVDEIVALWTACGLTRPWNDPAQDIALAVRGPASALLLGRDGGRVVASVMVGHDGHRGTVYYLAVAPGAQRRGLGRAMMDAAEAWVRARGLPKLHLMVRLGNEAVRPFYAALGYDTDPVMLLSKRF